MQFCLEPPKGICDDFYYNEKYNNKDNPIVEVSKEKVIEFIKSITDEMFYQYSEDYGNYMGECNGIDFESMLKEYYRIFNTIESVKCETFIIYLEFYNMPTEKKDFKPESAEYFAISEITIFHKFTSIENLRESINIFEKLFKLEHFIDFIKFKSSTKKEVFTYNKGKILCFLEAFINSIEYIITKYGHENFLSLLSESKLFSYSMQHNDIIIILTPEYFILYDNDNFKEHISKIYLRYLHSNGKEDSDRNYPLDKVVIKKAIKNIYDTDSLKYKCKSENAKEGSEITKEYLENFEDFVKGEYINCPDYKKKLPMKSSNKNK